MKKITIGILAHVDAGKTTLSEALLYLSGKIRTLGRVDHGNTYLDTYAVERERGITVFSKQARFSYGSCDFILLDTPGHVDFSPETERTLALLDYAVLVISAADGVQSHTRTLWQLLEHYNVPTFLFINKMDMATRPEAALMEELATTLSPHCISLNADGEDKDARNERLALVNERILDLVLAEDEVDDQVMAQEIAERRLFPCVFGSALRLTGVEQLLSLMDLYTRMPAYPADAFSAKVYKISRATSHRLTYMKITGGRLCARDEVDYLSADGRHTVEKINQIRLYSGDKFTQTDEVTAGDICAVTGLSSTYVGQGLGIEEDTCHPLLEPVLSYRIALPPGCDISLYFPKLKELEEEEPSLHLTVNGELRQIEARLMGDIQIDLLQKTIEDRLGITCTFDEGQILYKEKIASKTVGVGHFEPLRHYAEVQLYMEPQPKGTGLIFDTRVPENTLDTNWQRLILTHLYERVHRGTLTGAALTDTKITLVAGKAHLKHTEGGDFREATYRAVRHGLMKAGCILLEPYYQFRLEIPSVYVGRAMSDLQLRGATFEIAASTESDTEITGRGPVSELRGYPREIISYTGGKGQMTCVSDGYEPCHDQDRVVAEMAYDPEADVEHTPHSVFCSHGAGLLVHWREVDSYKHLEAGISVSAAAESMMPRMSGLAKRYRLSDADMEAIMLRTFGPIKRRQYSEPKVMAAAPSAHKTSKKAEAIPAPRMIIVDGYNVIYAWDALKEIADFSLEKARETLMDILSNYVAFTKTPLTLVFDAYLVQDGAGTDMTHDGYRVVYTKQDQTADAFIEKMMSELGPNYRIKVVTGDRLLQLSAVHSGISRMTAKEFEEEVTKVGNEITEFVRKLSSIQS